MNSRITCCVSSLQSTIQKTAPTYRDLNTHISSFTHKHMKCLFLFLSGSLLYCPLLQGHTPLHLAALHNHPEMVALLIDRYKAVCFVCYLRYVLVVIVPAIVAVMQLVIVVIVMTIIMMIMMTIIVRWIRCAIVLGDSQDNYSCILLVQRIHILRRGEYGLFDTYHLMLEVATGQKPRGFEGKHSANGCSAFRISARMFWK